MNKIEFPRTSYDGTRLTKESLEEWFLDKLSKNIHDKLIKRKEFTVLKNEFKIDPNKEQIWDCIINHLDDILLASPRRLRTYTRCVDRFYSHLFFYINSRGRKASTDFGKEILNAFNYETYRQNVLVELARKLDVKACPYCNMHYTLFAEEYTNKRTKNLAKFQFDHFFDKVEYPLLSMSLYNLIPSCAVCNNAKTTKNLSLNFHPYHSAICEQFHFEVEKPLDLYYAALVKKDNINIKIVEDDCKKDELDDFIDMFKIQSLYSRHKDIAQETFDKAYEEPYYLNPANFSFLSDKSPEYLERLWMGTYTSLDEIERRPMTKFIQDLWKQAKGT